MEVLPTHIQDVLILKPTVYSDNRGFFLETFNAREFKESTGLSCEFVQDNYSHSTQGTLRGLHYQLQQPQGKLVWLASGRVYDVALDLRRHSRTYGQHLGIVLDAADNRQVWIPPGFAHGFLVLSSSADFLYKTTEYYHPQSEHTIQWNDPALGIKWPLDMLEKSPILSEKDECAGPLNPQKVFD